MSRALINRRGAARWTQRLHPWIYRTDVIEAPERSGEDGAVRVWSETGALVGTALWNPDSAITLRMLTHDDRSIDGDFWRERIGQAAGLRDRMDIDSTAFRLVHAEADGLPALVVDRYTDVLVVQFLSAGIEPHRAAIVAALCDLVQPRAIIARDDVPIRAHEKLAGGVHTLHGDAPDDVEVTEAGVRWLAPVRTGQKTGGFLDQRENRVRAGTLARGDTLDAFCYHGSFALHLARRADRVVAIDSSAEALARGRANARLNGLNNIDFVEANVFDALREYEAAGERFDAIVLDPPAFVKKKDALARATRGYKEINLRAVRLLAPGGHLLTFSCSYHMGPDRFRAMLEDAAADAGRPMRWIESLGQAADHPVVLQIPESGYLKGAVLQAAR
ncbi:MAG: class I SAM-dependent rRNA methyltransferase [Gemmatimonadetes bacterium]|nr:class I SAM-dependent rRNA methyltransferase [Gemmatimonadota bacterium]